MGGRTDGLGELGLDQRLIDRLRGLADTVTDIGDHQRVEDFEQGRLVQGHRVAPLYEILGGFTQRHAVASPPCSATPSRPRTYTTSGDATLDILDRKSVHGYRAALQRESGRILDLVGAIR
jgi:hypothetical protein